MTVVRLLTCLSLAGCLLSSTTVVASRAVQLERRRDARMVAGRLAMRLPGPYPVVETSQPGFRTTGVRLGSTVTVTQDCGLRPCGAPRVVRTYQVVDRSARLTGVVVINKRTNTIELYDVEDGRSSRHGIVKVPLASGQHGRPPAKMDDLDLNRRYTTGTWASQPGGDWQP